MKYFLIFLPCLLMGTTLTGQQVARHLNKTFQVSVPVEYDYLLFLPTNQTLAEDGKLPLIVFLHGAGERGNDLTKVKVHGPPKIVEGQPDFPFMVLSPQCPEGERWDPLTLDLLLDEIVGTQPVDTTRIYLTGLSMGGFGTWDWALYRPHRFAALAPICGGTPWHAFQVSKIRHLPIWVFHGALDPVVPIAGSSAIVGALKQMGADVNFTVYPYAGHDSWTETYDNPELYDWFKQHRRKP